MTPRQKRILVVDDDDAIRALLFTILRRSRLAVDTAVNGEQALERLRTCRYSVILLDLMMPIMNGWEVLRRLDEMPQPDRPMAIVLTAGNEPRTMSPDLVAGTIHKPFDVAMLVEVVSGCLEALEAREQRAGCPPADSETPAN